MAGSRARPIGLTTNRRPGERSCCAPDSLEAEAVAAGWRSQLDEAERRAADYLLVTKEGVPAYLALVCRGIGLDEARVKETVVRNLSMVSGFSIFQKFSLVRCARSIWVISAAEVIRSKRWAGDENSGCRPFRRRSSAPCF